MDAKGRYERPNKNYCTKEKLANVNQDNVKLFDVYLDGTVGITLTESSAKIYKIYFGQFLIYLMEDWNNIGLYDEEFFKNSLDIINGYATWCEKVLKNNSKVLKTKLFTVASFYSWSVDNGIIEEHPFAKEGIRKVSETEYNKSAFEGKYLTEQQVKDIRKQIVKNKDMTIQDQLLFEIAYQCGLRIMDIKQLRVSDVNLSEMTIENPVQKRGALKRITFDETCRSLLSNWLALRSKSDKYDKLKCDALFISLVRGEWTPMAGRKMSTKLRSYAALIGLETFSVNQIVTARFRNLYKQTEDIVLSSQLMRIKD